MRVTALVTTAIIRLISTGTPELELLVAVARRFPELTRPEFVAAPNNATAGVEKQALHRHGCVSRQQLASHGRDTTAPRLAAPSRRVRQPLPTPRWSFGMWGSVQQ
jgi:hypothetical protein